MDARLFDIKLDTRKHTRWLDDIAHRQLPFAVAKTLTLTAKDAQGDIGTEMTGVMSLKSNYPKAGLKINPARKKDGLHRMTSEIGHKDWYMAQQMSSTTTVRKSRNADYQYIPRAVRKTKTGKISKANRPSNIFKKNVFFSKNGRDGGSIFQGKAGRSILLYSAIKQQTIKPKMDMHRTANLTASRRLDKNFINSMRIARRSAR